MLWFGRAGAQTTWRPWRWCAGITGLVVEYIVAIDVTRVRFPADATHVVCTRQPATYFTTTPTEPD